MKGDDKPIDLLELLTVGGRMRPERSRALPRTHYGDPANIVKFDSEKRKAKKWRKR